MAKVLITAKEVHELIPERLADLGYRSDHLPEPSEEELLEVIADYEGLIITTYTKVSRVVIDKAVQLKFIGRVGSGLENVDLAYAAEKGIQVFSSPEGNANAVGEHALALTLNLFNKISVAYQEVKAGIWKREENRGLELDGKVVGIIGLGHTGTAFAKKLRGFEVEVLAYDKYRKNYGSDFVTESTVDEILERADLISLHVPCTPETYHMVSPGWIAHTGNRPYLIHTCRGEVIDTEAVLAGLKSGQLRGLGIDVYEDEPWTKVRKIPLSVYRELFDLPQVIATPHIAGWTQESKFKLADILMDKISTWKTGII